MKQTILKLSAVAALLLYAVTHAADTNTTKTAATNAPAASTNKEPIRLQSVKDEAPRIPVYVIPEIVVVMTPIGPVTFAAQHNIEDLAKLFPAHRVTNIIIYNR